MKFVNYGIPTGLGIKEFNKNSNSNKYSNLNGIKNYNTENTENTKNTFSNIQLGGGFHNVSYLPCETVFYVIEHPITSKVLCIKDLAVSKKQC